MPSVRDGIELLLFAAAEAKEGGAMTGFEDDKDSRRGAFSDAHTHGLERLSCGSEEVWMQQRSRRREEQSMMEFTAVGEMAAARFEFWTREKST